jgi:hypothetical protein
MALIVAGLLLLAGYGASTLAEGVDLRASEQHRSDRDTGDSPASLVAQSFRSPRANLSRIELELSAFAELPEDGRISLYEGDRLADDLIGDASPTVWAAPLSAASFARNPYLTIDFPPIANSEGVTYTLVLETPERPLNTALAVRYTTYDTVSSGQMLLQPAGDEARKATWPSRSTITTTSARW